VGVADVDSSTLVRARVRIAGGRRPGDQLSLPPHAGIAGDYDPASGLLLLTGHASLGAYRDALRAVRFRTTARHAGTSRTVLFAASDGHLSSPGATRRVVLELGSACVNRVTGTDGPDAIDGTVGGDRLIGRGGGDALRGLGGADCLEGDRGDDDLGGGRGDDRLDGALGRDTLRGGRGSDHLDGGTGVDAYHAGPGNDRIDAQDSRAEEVDCGRGDDFATLDPADRPVQCEESLVIAPATRAR
jgi:hypothetical protein